ncbi:MAG: hypothetical protein ACRDH2_14560 [Anaerolineales bacterium]
MADPQPIQPRALVIVHNPIIRFEGGRKLNQVLNWNDPDELAQRYLADVRECSDGLVNYEIVERIEVDGFPAKQDGFAYTAETYLACWRARSGFHQPDGVDYHRLLDEFDIIPKINAGAVDEVWLFGFPYAGYYESIMAGPGAVWCNAPPLEHTSHAARRFVIMGFNYERGVGEMLEDLGHRAESILAHVFRHTRGEANLWERFTRYDKTHPGRAECGNVHFAPNSERDYDWGNRRPVLSRCDAWLSFPDLARAARSVDCREWGNGDIRLHHLWWFHHFPHVAGATNGVSNNWWEYVIEVNRMLA